MWKARLLVAPPAQTAWFARAAAEVICRSRHHFRQRATGREKQGNLSSITLLWCPIDRTIRGDSGHLLMLGERIRAIVSGYKSICCGAEERSALEEALTAPWQKPGDCGIVSAHAANSRRARL